MEGRRLLRSLSLKNVLSFGPEEQRLELQPLNVLIGPNGSGKSNLIEILGLLRAMPIDLAEPIREAGGFRDWFWKGDTPPSPIEVESTWEYREGEPPIRHRIAFAANPNRPQVKILDEVIDQGTDGDANHALHYRYLNTNSDADRDASYWDHHFEVNVRISPAAFRTDRSIITRLRDEQHHPGLSYLADRFSEIRLYRDWIFGRSSPVRSLQPADLRDDFLAEDAQNLFLILKKFKDDPETSAKFLVALKSIYAGVTDYRVLEIGEYLELAIHEDDCRFITARRLSDGTLRFLSLLAILCDPTPAPLISIEEPELGLHPDVVPTIAKLLIDASTRTQIIVTTHSPELITELWECPEAVVVCERGIDGTTMNRLDPDRLKEWLDKYTLGHLWSMGEIGGNRW